MKNYRISTEGHIHLGCAPCRDDACSPVVVISPEDREAVARLGELIRDQHQNNVFAIDDVQAALREFANPTLPKPEEPLGLGAVVEDSERLKWVCIGGRLGETRWRQDYGKAIGQESTYAEIAAVRVLSEGVSP